MARPVSDFVELETQSDYGYSLGSADWSGPTGKIEGGRANTIMGRPGVEECGVGGCWGESGGRGVGALRPAGGGESVAAGRAACGGLRGSRGPWRAARHATTPPRQTFHPHTPTP